MMKHQFTVDNSHNYVLSDLPYRIGRKSTVTVMAEDELRRRQRKWKTFFRQLQASPVAQGLTDDDIAREIEAYRNENQPIQPVYTSSG